MGGKGNENSHLLSNHPEFHSIIIDLYIILKYIIIICFFHIGSASRLVYYIPSLN